MARVSITEDLLTVELHGLHKLWALKSRIRVPLTQVRGATADPGIVAEPKGMHAPGTHVPGVLAAGTFRQNGERVFWNVQDGTRAVVIELADDYYVRLVIEVDDPGATVAMIERAHPR